MTLRDVTDDDLSILFEHQREPEANRMAAFPARERGAFMAHWRTNVLGSATARTQTIVVDGVVAGYVGSWDQDGKRLVAYWLGKAYWGRGVASAALADFVAHHDRTRPMFADVVLHNVGSIRVLEKSGFRRIGDPVMAADGITEISLRLDA
ncbi:MAG TPA: GNAT family N-acetyltransferase [Polyangia bacterium]|nr:GNAT family N-acetyltransferase [Polyangia bacterium]